jgi:integrase
LRRLGYANGDHVGHGFRSALSTLANDSGLFRADVIETALNHMDEDAVRGSYNDAAYHAERRRLSQWWADRCDELREERPSNIVALRPVVA